MKYFFVVLCALVAVAAVHGQGFPTRKCPPGEHSVLYCPRKAEPNCETPSVHDGPPGACDIPDCFCDRAPKVTVRDLRTGKCVEPSQCPQNVLEKN
ncbi:hypothetical protein MSG28_005568 [Choristoneura fumiferana]|uniref:Uncharacterized protein n=2 Tax=Choristoneura fumiferana TaxID=7141 RepID=A0ACC0KZX4_CHOFU|nr:hypothetical protein MSG28_005566 [Choristoneura fumiferana]KAI8441885.1 hypothetical protein MSG28_005568 [Choristoneura fumiferana]